MFLHQRVVWDQALHRGGKEKNRCGRKKKVIWEVIWGGERMAWPGDMPLMLRRPPVINLSLKCQHVKFSSRMSGDPSSSQFAS